MKYSFELNLPTLFLPFTQQPEGSVELLASYSYQTNLDTTVRLLAHKPVKYSD